MRIFDLAAVFSVYILALHFIPTINGADNSKAVLLDLVHGLVLIIMLYSYDLLKMKDGD
jgi:hypothetical protein